MYKLNYSFESTLNQQDRDAFASKYRATVCTSRGSGTTKVGEIVFDIIHCNQAMNLGFEIQNIFESEEQLSQIASDIYDYENYNLKTGITDSYSEVLPYSDLLIIKSISIKPEYRKLGISQMLINDLIKRFTESTALIIAYINPLQFASANIHDQSWNKELNLNQFNKDYESSIYKLKAYFKRMNFNHINGFDNYMFFNPLEDQAFLQLADISNLEEFSAS